MAATAVWVPDVPGRGAGQEEVGPGVLQSDVCACVCVRVCVRVCTALTDLSPLCAGSEAGEAAAACVCVCVSVCARVCLQSWTR